MEEEAARIQPLHHGHHRIAKPPKVELPSPVEAAAKARKAAQQLGSHAPRERWQRKPARWRDSQGCARRQDVAGVMGLAC